MDSIDNVQNSGMVVYQQSTHQESSSYTSSPKMETSLNSAAQEGHRCPKCGRLYRWKSTLDRHLRLECGKEPQFQCPYCPYRAKRKSNLEKHIILRHHIMKKLWKTVVIFIIVLKWQDSWQYCFHNNYCNQKYFKKYKYLMIFQFYFKNNIMKFINKK